MKAHEESERVIYDTSIFILKIIAYYINRQKVDIYSRTCGYMVLLSLCAFVKQYYARRCLTSDVTDDTCADKPFIV